MDGRSRRRERYNSFVVFVVGDGEPVMIIS